MKEGRCELFILITTSSLELQGYWLNAEVDLLIANFRYGRCSDGRILGRNSPSRTAALAKAVSQLELRQCARSCPLVLQPKAVARYPLMLG
jgi:hypothetical protein